MCEESIQEWVCTRVKWVKDDQDDLGMRHGDEWAFECCSNSKKGDRCHAGEVGKYEHSHALGHFHVLIACDAVRFADGEVDVNVAGTDDAEGKDTEAKNANDVDL